MHRISSPYPAPLLYISNYFCKNLVIVSSKLKSYKEAIVAFWKKLSVSISVAQLTGLSISSMHQQDRQHYMTI